LLSLAISTGLLISAIFFALYLALEPYVRSKWPQTIVSWTRLLAGNLRDPLVGRDLLFGTILGMSWVLVFFLGYLLDIRVGESPLLPDTTSLQGVRSAAGLWLTTVLLSVFGVLTFFFVLVLLRVLVRNRWLAAVLFVAVYAGPKVLASNHRLIDTPIWLIIYGISAFAVVRFGLVTLLAAVFVANLMLNLPYTLDTSRWYAGTTMGLVLSVALLAAWGYYSSLAGKKLLREDFFD
jgi:hypothetical protein